MKFVAHPQRDLTYPVIFNFDGNLIGLTVYEAEELIVQLRDALADSAGPYVQVRYLGRTPSYRAYTYRDPSGTLEVGDLVEVDGAGNMSIASVVALGRGEWTGPVKDVAARIHKEPL